jgi:hypothetical protein
VRVGVYVPPRGGVLTEDATTVVSEPELLPRGATAVDLLPDVLDPSVEELLAIDDMLV